jgi:hypothetical protein
MKLRFYGPRNYFKRFCGLTFFFSFMACKLQKFGKNLFTLELENELDFFGDTLDNFGNTQMCRDTRFEKHWSNR